MVAVSRGARRDNPYEETDAPIKRSSSPVEPRLVPTLPPLGPNGLKIRLLTVQPHVEGQSITCTVRVCAFSSKPKYTALSYMWGKQTGQDEKQIVLNDQPCSVGKNLADFLASASKSGSALRRRLQPSVWIDALCIDQSNNTEKSQQVAMMDKIYHDAVEVCVWLGTDPNAWPRIERDQTSHGKPAINPATHQRQTEFQAYQRDMLVGNPYFERLWVVQEVRLSRQLMVACGDRVVAPPELDKQMQHVYTSIPRIGASKNGFDRARWFFDSSLIRDPKSMVHWLRALRLLKCKDPRDRVFAIRSLVANGHMIVPDYSLTHIELYIVVIQSHLLQSTMSIYADMAELSYELRRSLRLWRSFRSAQVHEGYDGCEVVGEPRYAAEVAIHSVVSRGSSSTHEPFKGDSCAFSFPPTTFGSKDAPPVLVRSRKLSDVVIPVASATDTTAYAKPQTRREVLSITRWVDDALQTVRATFLVSHGVDNGCVICKSSPEDRAVIILRPSLFVPEGLEYDKKDPNHKTLGSWLSYTFVSLAVLDEEHEDPAGAESVTGVRRELYTSFLGTKLQLYLDEQQAMLYRRLGESQE